MKETFDLEISGLVFMTFTYASKSKLFATESWKTIRG